MFRISEDWERKKMVSLAREEDAGCRLEELRKRSP